MSQSSDRPAEVANGAARKPFPSIAARMAAFYALSTGVLFLAAGLVLYRTLKRDMERADRLSLLEEIRELRLILQERPNNPEDLAEDIRLESAASPAGQRSARVLDPEGNTLVETFGMNAGLPARAFPDPVGPEEEPSRGELWQSATGRFFHLMSAQASLGHSSKPDRIIQVATDFTKDASILSKYARILLAVFLAGLLISATAGIAIARSGMKPIADVSRAAQETTAGQLHRRLDPSHFPRELQPLAAEFNAMLDRLEESFARMSQFSADLAHELRTPLNNLRGEVEVALSRPRSADEYAQTLQSNLEEFARLSNMMDGLLFLARADEGAAGLHKERHDARREMEAVCEFFAAIAEEDGIQLSCEGDATVHADSPLLRRAISNLLANALHNTPRGGQVRIAARRHGSGAVEIRVVDNGRGIAPEHLPHIFDRFYRADSSRNSESGGTGLGLAIVKSIMTLHSGAVFVSSTQGAETVFTLLFPP